MIDVIAHRRKSVVISYDGWRILFSYRIPWVAFNEKTFNVFVWEEYDSNPTLEGELVWFLKSAHTSREDAIETEGQFFYDLVRNNEISN